MPIHELQCKCVDLLWLLNLHVLFRSLSDINMAMWNNLRVESLFSVVACALGLLFLLASLRPCCEQPRLPLYLGSLAFFASGKMRICTRFLKVNNPSPSTLIVIGLEKSIQLVLGLDLFFTWSWPTRYSSELFTLMYHRKVEQTNYHVYDSRSDSVRTKIRFYFICKV